jgi:hypothetical protein
VAAAEAAHAAVLTAPHWRGPARRPRRAGAVLAAFVAGFVLFVVASVVGVTIGSGASLVGGVGDVSVAPTTPSQVLSHYRLGIGRLRVDLAKASFSAKGRTVVASVGVGELLIVLPAKTIVYVDATSGVGSVRLPRGASARGPAVEVSRPAKLVQQHSPSTPRLTLDAHVGVGVVKLSWGS